MNDFEAFWSHYPNKKGKGYARKCYEKAAKNGLPDIGKLIKAIDDQKREKAYLRSQNRFVPEWKNPSTWINQECWGDECILPPKREPQGARVVHTFQTLQRAHNILCNLGRDQFEDYCRQLRISDYDRECVLMAANGGVRHVRQLAGGMFEGV